jgi:adenylate kinase
VGKYGKKVCEINTTGKTPEDVVERILDILKGKEKGRIGIVDWLGKLYREGKLDKFLG